MTSNKTLYLLDGSSVMYRSFYALKLSTSKGLPVGALYGFITTLRKIMRKYNPEYMAVCFDVSRKTFRQEKYSDYKVQRPPVPDALKSQIPPIKEVVSLWGLKIIEKEGYEADDLIAALASYAAEEKWRVVIITNDKDMYQLISDDVIVVYNPVQDKMYDEKKFVDEFGFTPSSIVDYLALTGDSVDNIPGAKGIGKVGAGRLIKEFGSVDNVFHNLDKIGDRLRNLIEASRDSIFLSKELVKLEGLPSPVKDIENLKVASPQYDRLFAFYREWEFNSFIKDLPLNNLRSDIRISHINDKEILGQLRKNKRVFFYLCEGDCFIFDENKRCVYAYPNRSKIIVQILTDENIEKVSYDFKSSFKGEEVNYFGCGRYFDVMIAAYIINPALGDYSLVNLASVFLGKVVTRISPSEGAMFVFELYRLLGEKIKEGEFEKLFFDVEMPLVEVLATMEGAGVAVDRGQLESLLTDVDNQITEVTHRIYSLSGKEFNLNSPKQLSKILFDDLKIPPLKKTKRGFSTDEEVLQKLADKFPVAAYILEYRHLNKLRSTYLLPFLDEINKRGGRIHAEFNQTATQTGRLSCRAPNLQNIPIKSDYAQKIRKIFVPTDKEGFILSGDYSQIELRILAHFSEEENLISAFKKNADIHSFTASLIFGVPEEKVDRRQREVAKRINFGIIYGMSPYGLSRELNITEEEARKFIEDYFLRYPRVKEFIDKTISFVQQKGFVRTLMGRVRYLPDINSSRYELREFARRQAINTPIQGSAADLIKVAMIRIFRDFQKNGFASRMIMQVHDELVFDVAKGELDKVAEVVRTHMEESIELKVPVVVNLKVGKNWLDMESYD